MDKEKILSQNKKDNLYLDEYEKHIKLQGKSFGLMFVLFICILILFIKTVCKEPFKYAKCTCYLYYSIRSLQVNIFAQFSCRFVKACKSDKKCTLYNLSYTIFQLLSLYSTNAYYHTCIAFGISSSEIWSALMYEL